MFKRTQKLLKNNFELIFCFFLFIIIFIIAVNPETYITSTLKGLRIWAEIVLPSLFCFFVLTKLLMQSKSTLKTFGFLNKPFKKCFKTENAGGYIFIMSLISGYPIGAKLISEFYQSNQINCIEAHKLSSFCSTSGLMFIMGSLASKLFSDIKIGIIIFISHILGAFLNGFLYRNIETKKSFLKKKKISYQDLNISKKLNAPRHKQNLNSIMYDTIISVLMIGGYISICFTLLEVILNLKIMTPVTFLFDKIFPTQKGLGDSIICGIVEMTSGCVKLFENGISKNLAAIISTFLVSFGGLSIHLQSQMFLTKCNIKYKFFLLSKISHSIISVLLAVVFSILML